MTTRATLPSTKRGSCALNSNTVVDQYLGYDKAKKIHYLKIVEQLLGVSCMFGF
jgi:hypothetical protein